MAYLATEDCPIAGKVFWVRAGEVHLFQPWTVVDHVATDHRWTVAELAAVAGRFASAEFDRGSIIRLPPLTS